MAFHVPETARDIDHPLLGTTADGNNGAFHIESPEPGWRLALICSDGEEWLPVIGFEHLYEVSTLGRVRALPKRVALPRNGWREHDLHELQQETLESGYRRVSLCTAAAIKRVLVHELVARAFIENPHDFPEVNHRNGVKSSNHVTNLEWCSTAYNHHHAIENGLRAGLTVDEIEEIRELLNSGMTANQIAELLGRARKTIWDIKTGRHRSLTPEPPTGYTGPPLWQHVSVHAYRRMVAVSSPVRMRTPTWKEMSYVKRLCWDAEDVVMQLHPRESEYINCHPHVLHLWRPINADIPTPPAYFVGPTTAVNA